jgi:hypothetical protein
MGQHQVNASHRKGRVSTFFPALLHATLTGWLRLCVYEFFSRGNRRCNILTNPAGPLSYNHLSSAGFFYCPLRRPVLNSRFLRNVENSPFPFALSSRPATDQEPQSQEPHARREPSTPRRTPATHPKAGAVSLAYQRGKRKEKPAKLSCLRPPSLTPKPHGSIIGRSETDV